MGRDPKRRKRNLIAFAILVVLALAYSIFGKHKMENLSIPDKVGTVVVLKVGQEETLNKEKSEAVWKLLKDAKIKKSEDREKIMKSEYPESYGIRLYQGKKVKEIYYLLPDGRIYDPANQKVYRLRKEIGESLRSNFGF